MSEDTPPEKDGTAEMPTEVIKTAADPASEYIAGVRAALSDLPASEVAEILDDVMSHLADLATELGPDAGTPAFTDRLGTPQAYAAELRAAAGYPPAPAVAPKIQTPGPVAAGFAVAGLVTATLLAFALLLTRSPILILLAIAAATIGLVLIVRDGPRLPTVAALPSVSHLRAALPGPGRPARGVLDFLVSLQPAWWVLRAVIAALLVEQIFLGRGSWLVALVVAIAGVFVSIWLGQQSRRDRRWLWLVVPLNGLAVGAALTAFAGSSLLSGAYSSAAYVNPTPVWRTGLWQGSNEIRDIRPVDAAGNPLTGIYLFDQDGRPIAVEPECTDYSSFAPSTDTLSPNGPQVRVHPQVPYPQGVARSTPNGDCVTIPPGPLVVAVPKPTAGPSATPTPVATPTGAAQPTGANPPANGAPVTTKPGTPN